MDNPECKDCQKTSYAHNCCMRHSLCWENKLFNPSKCNFCKENFKIASCQIRSDTRTSARGRFSDWLKTLIKNRRKLKDCEEPLAIWINSEIQVSFKFLFIYLFFLILFK